MSVQSNSMPHDAHDSRNAHGTRSGSASVGSCTEESGHCDCGQRSQEDWFCGDEHRAMDYVNTLMMMMMILKSCAHSAVVVFDAFFKKSTSRTCISLRIHLGLFYILKNQK